MTYKLLLLISLFIFVGAPYSDSNVVIAQDTTEVDEGSELDSAPSRRGRRGATTTRGSRGGDSRARGGRSSREGSGIGAFFKNLFGKRAARRAEQAATEDRTRTETPGRRIEKLSQEELNYEFLVYARRGDMRLVKDLLEEGALINSKDRHGRTALIEASRTGNIELCKMLIDMGASVSLRDMYDGTAIMYASKAGHVDIVNLLLKNGARNEQY